MTGAAQTDVLVIGAGPTGLTLAVDLARRGIDFRIVERDAEPNRASRAKTIQPRSLEVLDDLGAVDHILRVGVAHLPVRFHEPSGGLVDRPPISVRAEEGFHSPYLDPLWIGQSDVELALRRRLDELGGRVDFGTEAVGIDQDDDGVDVTLTTAEGDQSLRARFVVAADGGRSTTRKLVGLPLVGTTYEEQRWYLGDVTALGLDRTYMHIWPSDRGMLGLTPLGSEGLWQFQSPILPGETPETPSLEFYQRLFDERAGRGAVRLTSASWLSVYLVNARLVDDYRKGRVLLAGDAAHVHSAAGGQGMNTGIQDAYNLGWKLDSALAGARQSLLDTYTAERRPVAQTVLKMSTDKMVVAMEAAGAGTEEGLGAALANISDGSLNSGLGIHYRSGPITYPADGAASGPVAGDRAPDAIGLEGEGFTGTLFDLMRGPHWSLVVWEHADPVVFDNAKPTHMHVHRLGAGPASPIVDGKGAFQRIYQPYPGELVLIRADGYIAARMPASAEMDVINHLAPFRSIGNTVRPY